MTLRVLKGAAASGFAAGLALAVLAASAWAGEYHVYSCRTPAGQVAPTDGWSAPEHPPYERDLEHLEAGGGLIAALDADYVHPSRFGKDKSHMDI